ncbi:hypothetical protein HZC35_01790 [Candidatus Saganbacteria bacterium]|nr:hypothetical protein [Candidatus Saganbacteria bacterium]
MTNKVDRPGPVSWEATLRAVRGTSSADPARHWLDDARLRVAHRIPTPRDIADLVNNLASLNNIRVLFDGKEIVEGGPFHLASSSLIPEGAYGTLLVLAECGRQAEPVTVALEDARDLAGFYHPKLDFPMLVEVTRIRQICTELSKVGAEVVFNLGGEGAPLKTIRASRIREFTQFASRMVKRPLSAVLELWRKDTWTLEENMRGRFWLEDILGLKPGAVMY